jgi:hypothetical protein
MMVPKSPTATNCPPPHVTPSMLFAVGKGLRNVQTDCEATSVAKNKAPTMNKQFLNDECFIENLSHFL